MKAKKKHIKKSRKMLQLIKRAERRKKMKNSEKKIVKEDGEKSMCRYINRKQRKEMGKRETHHVT